MPKGGDLRSQRIAAYGGVILAANEAEVDITMPDPARRLGRMRGLVGPARGEGPRAWKANGPALIRAR